MKNRQKIAFVWNWQVCWTGAFLCVELMEVLNWRFFVLNWRIWRVEPLSSTHQFNTGITPFQHPKTPQFNRPFSSTQKSLSSTHSSVQHQNPWVQHTSQFNTKIPQFNTKILVSNWGVCWTEGFQGWKGMALLCWTEGIVELRGGEFRGWKIVVLGLNWYVELRGSVLNWGVLQTE